MDVYFAGGSTFTIRGEASIDFNPTEPPGRGVLALYSTVQRRSKLVVNGPGEYEIGGVMVSSVRLGGRDSKALGHSVRLDRMNVVFLESRLDALGEEAPEAFGHVDVLIVRVDDVKSAQAAVQALLPRVVLPYGSQALEMCEALGVKAVQAQMRFSWNGIVAAPKAILLKAASRRKRAA